MSHVTDIKLRIKHLADLQTAAAECGLDFLENQKTFETYAGSKNRCQHALRLKDHQPGRDFEIGVLGTDDLGYELKTDLWGQSRMLAAVGDNFNKLRQEYTVATSLRAAQPLLRKGFLPTRENLPDGRVRLALRKR